jgi:two-component system chemotaxis response regulator CheY
MCATLSLARPTVLVIHDDGEALDTLTRLFEASGFEVATAVTAFRAQAYLEGDRPVGLVVVPWDAAHPVGGELYRWVLQRRYDLRDGFVFLAAETPPDFDRLVAGRCLAVAVTRPMEIIRVATAAVKRRQQLEAARDAALEVVGDDRPSLLLADDEPVLLMVMADLLNEAGYAVSRVDSGHGAILLLENEEFDVIVTDWNMDDGNGADVYRWILLSKPWLADRVVFLADEEGQDAAVVAPGRPMFRKGQDSHALSAVLREIVRPRGS